MPTRILLAVLILTNPICCQMFGSVETVRSEEPAAECEGCACQCGQGEQFDTPDDRPNVPHTPCECPSCALCQCVCAGAIVQDTVTVETSHHWALVDMIVPCPLNAVSSSPHDACLPDAFMACGKANVGRSARILHASLLC